MGLLEPGQNRAWQKARPVNTGRARVSHFGRPINTGRAWAWLGGRKTGLSWAGQNFGPALLVALPPNFGANFKSNGMPVHLD